MLVALLAWSCTVGYHYNTNINFRLSFQKTAGVGKRKGRHTALRSLTDLGLHF